MLTKTVQKQTTNLKGDEVMKKKKGLPKRLKKYRVDAGYSIYSLADRLGVNFSTVSYWENGHKFPRQGKMMELEELFGAGYRDLFTDLTEEEAAELERKMQDQIHSKKDKK